MPSDSHLAAERKIFEEFLASKGRTLSSFLQRADGEYADVAMDLLWQTWLWRAGISARVQRLVTAEPRTDLLLAAEDAVIQSREGDQEVAVGFDPLLPIQGMPSSWAKRAFAKITWFEWKQHHSFEVMGCWGWQLSADQRDTVLDEIIRQRARGA